MAILFVYINAWSAVGGIQQFNKNILTALEGEVIQSKVSALALHDYPKDFPTKTGISYVSCQGRRILFLWHLLRLGVIHQTILVGHINLLNPITFLLGYKCILLTHGIEIWKPLSVFKKANLRLLFKIATVSTYTQKRIIDLYPFTKHKIALLPNTIDARFVEGCRAPDKTFLNTQFGFSEQDKIILTVCRLTVNEFDKGYDKVIACLPDLKKKHPTIKYVLAGKYEEAEKYRLRILAKGLAVDDIVFFTGFVATTDLPSVYASAKVFIMPSKKEGFGIVFIEALLAECVVVAGNVDGSVDALQAGQTGILVNPDNVQEISIALDRVLSGEIPAHLQDKNRTKQKTLEVFGFAAFEQNLMSILNN